MARPSKLTPEVQNELIKAISMGSTYELACNFAGISYQTFRNWMIAGEKGTNGHADLYRAIKQAEGRAAVGWLAKIEKAANDGAWQAAAWKMERRYPNEYGRTVQQIEGKDGGPVAISVVRIHEPGDS